MRLGAAISFQGEAFEMMSTIIMLSSLEQAGSELARRSSFLLSADSRRPLPLTVPRMERVRGVAVAEQTR